MNKLVVANLVHRPLRSAISIVAIAIEVTLILVIVGLTTGMLNDSKQRQAGIGADVMVQPPGSSFLTGLTGAPVSIKIADKLAKLPHVTAVAPVIFQVNTQGSFFEVIYGIDLDSFEKMGGPFKYIAGGPFQQPYDILIDDYFAESKHIKVGDKLPLLNNEFRVCGIVEHGKGARKFVQLSTLQDLLGAQGKASTFYMKLDDPKNADLVVNEIHGIPGMNNYAVRSMREYLSMMTVNNVPGFAQFIRVVVGVAVIIGFIVIFQSMYTAVMERTREIGILKAMGASKFYIVNVVLRETLLLTICGIALGIAISFAAKAGILAKYPTLRIEIQNDWMLWATVIAVIGALIGAAYPAFKAAQKDPIDALAYE